MEQSNMQTLATPETTAVPAAKIKVLPAAVIKEIEQQNKARRLMGLSAIDIKIRNCLHCGGLFQSAGRRTCGCNTIHTSSLAGVEII
ncbi:MAG TPA: hypothetical protein VE954_05125 [Oligoflexus sp.]|uniref:hypothetical protein n=1 Tax=Oligoflexus sp. TaxID=1971216 RepID=UPI002D21F344|nr:hypothetical protein [Oligoflexus sp.]HYX32474.1 hypothetical protein [Oligoflexus sp.]